MLRLYTARVARHFPQATKAQMQLLLAVRRTVLKALPGCDEFIKWDSLSYQEPDPGGAIKGGVCQISLRGGQVVIGFVHGAGLPDPAGLLIGTGKAKRFLPIPNLDSLKDKRRVALLRAAAHFALTGGPNFFWPADGNPRTRH